MGRLDKQREAELQPKRILFAKSELNKRGIQITSETSTTLEFNHKSEVVRFFPYSGWFTGKSVKDGRGIKNLLNQIDETPR